MAKIRTIEYYRCWPGNGSDAGTWDTAYIEIPPDTVDEAIEDAIRDAVDACDWPNGKPLLTGLYCDSDPVEVDDSGEEPDKTYLCDYNCPGCGLIWSEVWSCACNVECYRCGIKDIQPTHYQEVRDDEVEAHYICDDERREEDQGAS
jgi:hypothetical protein